MLKKALTLLIFACLLITLAPTPAYAQSSSDNLLKIYCQRRKGNQLNLETWYGGRCGGSAEESIGFGDIILLDLMEKMGGSSGEIDFPQIRRYLENDTSSNPQSVTLSDIQNTGAIPAVAYAITYLYKSPPASSIDYLADISRNISNKRLVQPVHAQSTGYGFQALSSVLPIWRVFRNMAYLAFIFAFIVYGFMIMLRIKINPQTIVSVQMALPKLLLTLILISFSYAIAGFMIDLFYLIIGFMYSLFKVGNVVNAEWLAKWASGQTGGLIPSALIFMGSIVGNIGTIASGIMNIPIAVGSLIVTFLLPLTIIIVLLLLLATLVTFIKIFWMLLQSYVKIILNIIFAPLILLGNILPGSNSFGTWLKNIFAELSTFASTIIMLTLAYYFLSGGFQIFGIGLGELKPSNPFWTPEPLAGRVQQDLLYGLWGGNANTGVAGKFALLGLGMLLITPKIANMIKDALKMRSGGYESAIADSLRFGFGITTKPITGPFNYVKSAVGREGSQALGNIVNPRIWALLNKFGLERNQGEGGQDVG